MRIGDVFVRTHARLADDISAPLKEVTLVTSVHIPRYGGPFLTWARVTIYSASLPTIEEGHGDEEEMMAGAAMSIIRPGKTADWMDALNHAHGILLRESEAVLIEGGHGDEIDPDTLPKGVLD